MNVMIRNAIEFLKFALIFPSTDIAGKSQTANIDASIDRIRKADAVAQTKIVYHEKELLQLIHRHLMDKVGIK